MMGKEPDLYVYMVKDNQAILKNYLGYIRVRILRCEGLKEGDLVVIMGQQRLRIMPK